MALEKSSVACCVLNPLLLKDDAKAGGTIYQFASLPHHDILHFVSQRMATQHE